MHKDIQQQQQQNTKWMDAFPANAELNNVNLTRNLFIAKWCQFYTKKVVIQNDWNGNEGKNQVMYYSPNTGYK